MNPSAGIAGLRDFESRLFDHLSNPPCAEYYSGSKSKLQAQVLQEYKREHFWIMIYKLYKNLYMSIDKSYGRVYDTDMKKEARSGLRDRSRGRIPPVSFAGSLTAPLQARGPGKETT